MAPCTSQKGDSGLKGDVGVNPALQLANIKAAIPKKCFKKSLFWSTYYMLFDYSIWLGSLYVIYTLNNSSLWSQMPFWQQAVATLLFWNVCGFYMWCIFVVGHDCGHTNFSNYPIINDIIGHITHGSLMVPFYPWQLSHRRHHMYHNHIDKDYSHPWYTEETLELPKERLGKMLHEMHFLRFMSPFFGWWLYIYGKPDGSHFIPFPKQRMWREAAFTEHLKCLLSATVCGLYLLTFYVLSGYSLPVLAYYYLAPLGVFGWWLTTVTYLQHHSPHTIVYDDKDWKFVDAAFETVDRKYGFGIDTLSHHITDGHVVHHLFFTKIPHYHLPAATKAIQQYMGSHPELKGVYKFEKTYDFMFRVHRYFVQLGFKAKLFGGDANNSKKAVTEEKKKGK